MNFFDYEIILIILFIQKILIKMRDDSLLKLENKLNNYSSKDIISSKFILKPEISRIDLSKGNDFVKNIGSFVEKFKIQNNEILNDKKKLEDLNIESETLLNKNLRRKKKNASQPEIINTENNQKNNTDNNLENNKENNIEKKPEKKFIEMNLKLGILDLIKKKPLIEEVDKVEGEDLENDCEKKETNLEKMTSIIKTDDILNSIFNERIKNTSNSEEDKEFKDYPFIDFKNDNFNKEILNFLLENSGGNNKKKKNKNIQGETSQKKIYKNRNVVSNKRKIEK